MPNVSDDKVQFVDVCKNSEPGSDALMSKFVKECLADINGSSTNDDIDARICLVNEDGFIIDKSDSLMFDSNGNV